MKHLITLKDITTDEFHDILKLTEKLKYENKNGITHHLLRKNIGNDLCQILHPYPDFL